MKPRTTSSETPQRRKRGFERTSGLLAHRIRKASEKRGFAEARVLTHWAEIVGEEVAAVTRPVSVSYSKGGFGATLTVLTTGAQATLLQMQEQRLREKINAVYGYAAISRLRFTQTAPEGFAEGQVEFTTRKKPARTLPDAGSRNEAAQLASDVADDGLRRALESLGAEVFHKTRKTRSETPE